MPVPSETIRLLADIPNVTVSEGAPLSRYTRFGIGGPAEVYAEAASEQGLEEAFEAVRAGGALYTIIGAGTNLIVSDAGFPGIVLRFTAAAIDIESNGARAAAGAELQSLVDVCNANGMRGLETMTGIPGSVGAAVYGNAGAYGHSINESIRQVRFLDGEVLGRPKMRVFQNAACEFRYRESVFKRHKDWIIVSVEFSMYKAPPEELQKTSDDIFKIRSEKYPASMKCAGSIFKNLIVAELPEPVRRQVPERVIREGKVASAYFLEQVGAKGLQNGGIRVADYHANLIYNAGHGTARELCQVLDELKTRVRERFGLALEEEVQYVGFSQDACRSNGEATGAAKESQR